MRKIKPFEDFIYELKSDDYTFNHRIGGVLEAEADDWATHLLNSLNKLSSKTWTMKKLNTWKVGKK